MPEPVNNLTTCEMAATLECMLTQSEGGLKLPGAPTVVTGVSEPSTTMVVHFGHQAFRVVITEIMH